LFWEEGEEEEEEEEEEDVAAVAPQRLRRKRAGEGEETPLGGPKVARCFGRVS